MDLVHLVMSGLNLSRPGTCRLLPGHTKAWPRIDSWRTVHLETLTPFCAVIAWRKGHSFVHLRLQKEEDDDNGTGNTVDVSLSWNDPSAPERQNHLHFAKMTRADVMEMFRRMNAPEDRDIGIASRAAADEARKPTSCGFGRLFAESRVLPFGIGAAFGLAIAVSVAVGWSAWKERNRTPANESVPVRIDQSASSPVAQALNRADVRLIADLMRILDLVEKRQPIPEDVLNRLPTEVRETLMPMLRPITVPPATDSDTSQTIPSDSAPSPSLPPVLPPENVPRDRFGIPMVPSPRP